MKTRTSNDIARIFCKDRECEFFLTKKQAGWLFDVFGRENPGVPLKSRGYLEASGSFYIDDVFFSWRASEIKNGAAKFKVLNQYSIDAQLKKTR